MKNCEFYGLFDYTSGDGDTYEYTSAEWSRYLKGITGNGISKNALNEFEPTANGLTITIASGEAYIEGRYAYNTTATQFSLSPTSSGQKRYDRVVVELDEANRVIGLNVVAGTATTSTPAKPALTSKQLPICSILVENGSTTTLTDERVFTYSATMVQKSYLPLTGGTLTGNLVIRSNSYPQLCLQNASAANLTMLYADTTSGAYSDVKLRIYSDASTNATYSFGKNGTFQAPGAVVGYYFIAKKNSYPSVQLKNNSGTSLAELVVDTATGSYGNTVLNVWKDADTKRVFTFGKDGTFNCSTLVPTNALGIAYGGTGATTAAGALSNLGIVYSSTEPTTGNGSIWLKPVS